VSGCPQSKYFEAEENLLLDFEFFIGVEKRQNNAKNR
jgi:hypothetical protein